jgi:UPF0716 protein FxsA
MLRIGLFLAFLVVPVLEIWLLIQIGSVIGGWQTVALLIADSLVGAWLVRREGRRAWAALQSAVQSGRMPDRELADGGMVVAGGALLVTPGFLTDILGFILILPFTRPLARRALAWFLRRRVQVLAARSPYGPFFRGGPETPERGRVVHGEVIDGQVIDGEARERRPRDV